MAKRKNRAKRSIQSLPKGLPVKPGGKASNNSNPFEATQRSKRPKFQVANRTTAATASNTTAAKSQLAQALERRATALRESLASKKKKNVFTDKRIGEHDAGVSVQEQNLARLVRERSRRSKRSSKFALNDDNTDDDTLTHGGKKIDARSAKDHVMLSDDDDDEESGNLDAFDTSLHFGGNKSDERQANVYGSTGSMLDMKSQYAQKKMDLDELILRRKVKKAERLQSRETQADAFEKMDSNFAELAEMLQFRDKEKDIKEYVANKRAGTLSKEDAEMAQWDAEMKRYLYVDRKVKASNRTQTKEEIAKEEAERLHELETRRLARMNGDFENDDFSDLDEPTTFSEQKAQQQPLGSGKQQKSKHQRAVASTQVAAATAEALDNDSDHEETNDEYTTTRMTEDGLVTIDKHGEIVRETEQPYDTNNREEEDDLVYTVGQKVTASFRAKEQYGGNESWFGGTVLEVTRDDKTGNTTYTIEYDDNDFEEGVEPRHMRPVERSAEEVEKEAATKDKEGALKLKRKRAKEKARSELPFVFEVPTTLEALHDMIGTYATTGKDVSLIIQRIHKANSVRLDRRNAEKMQNFYDVLIRRFVAVGDAIYKSGNGGDTLGRYAQLDALTHTLYGMAQESSEIAGAVWSRRLGFFQSAHAKRLRDAAMELLPDDDGDEEEDGRFTAWPSTGAILALRVIGHIFPVTDKRHCICTPTILFLGQLVSHTPILSMDDLVAGTMCCGLLIEYSREAKRIVPEAHAFLASVIRLFSAEQSQGGYVLPTFHAASTLEPFLALRSQVSRCEIKELAPQLSLEADAIRNSDMPAAIIYAALDLIEAMVKNLAGSLGSAEKEAFAEITESVLALKPKNKPHRLPQLIRRKVASVACALSTSGDLDGGARVPLQRRAGPTIQEAAVKSLAPRLENPERYSMSKDKGKSAPQAAADRARREYKREHKAVARELRLDGAFIEGERRTEQHKKDSASKAKRQKAFAWMEGEQAVMNQQVRQGGGLLQGGGMGAAKAKAKTGKFGIKKGGKL